MLCAMHYLEVILKVCEFSRNNIFSPIYHSIVFLICTSPIQKLESHSVAELQVEAMFSVVNTPLVKQVFYAFSYKIYCN
jgi:hypothetical protein